MVNVFVYNGWVGFLLLVYVCFNQVVICFGKGQVLVKKMVIVEFEIIYYMQCLIVINGVFQ